MEKEIALGIDIGGTNTKYGLVERDGKITTCGEMGTNGYAQPQDFVAALHANVSQLMAAEQTEYEIACIGVGAPNGNLLNGCIEHAANLEWKGVVPIAEMIRDAFGKEVVLSNDANAAAIGEMMFGAARGMRDFIQITLGTGVGSGIVCNGKLITGSNGFAGELGHTVIRPGGRLHTGTGLKGSLEMYCSAQGMVMNALEILATDPSPSTMRDIPADQFTAKDISDHAKAGDELAIKTITYTGNLLGEALANFVLFSAPEAIILFGGLTNAGELLRKPAETTMNNNLLKVFQNKVKVKFSELPEAHAAILGASGMAWENFEKKD